MAALDPFYSDQIIGFEGFAPQAAWDYKQHSNGYGTKALYPGETIDKETAQQRFDAELGKAAEFVNKVAPDAPAGTKAALTSLTYNAGTGWANSGLGEAVKSGDWSAAKDRFLQYNKAGGDINPGLVKRRQAEASWFDAPPIAGPQQPTQTAQAPMSIAPPGAAPSPLAGLMSLAPQQAQQQAASAPMEMPSAPPLNLPPEMQQVIRRINLAKAFQNIPTPAGFRGYRVG